MMCRWLLSTLFLALPAQAGGLGSVVNLAQDEFRKLSEDLGAAAAYKGVTPATPLGVIGFDVGLELTSTKIENSSFFGLAGAGSQSELTIPKLHISKGLLAGLDIGVFIASMPDLSGGLYGADLRYAIIDDTLATPAVAVRISGTTTHNLGGVDVATVAADLMVSKKFAVVTPYAGVGMVRVQSRPDTNFLADEKFNKSRVFAGLNVNLAVINVAFEAEKMGNNNSLSAKVGWRF